MQLKIFLIWGHSPVSSHFMGPVRLYFYMRFIVRFLPQFSKPPNHLSPYPQFDILEVYLPVFPVLENVLWGGGEVKLSP
jgi:hypothetical protein